MINKIAFTGRETLLTKGLKKSAEYAAERTTEYFNESNLISYPKTFKELQDELNELYLNSHPNRFLNNKAKAAEAAKNAADASGEAGSCLHYFG